MKSNLYYKFTTQFQEYSIFKCQIIKRKKKNIKLINNINKKKYYTYLCIVYNLHTFLCEK